jgi:hypothetical protein
MNIRVCCICIQNSRLDRKCHDPAALLAVRGMTASSTCDGGNEAGLQKLLQRVLGTYNLVKVEILDLMALNEFCKSCNAGSSLFMGTTRDAAGLHCTRDAATWNCQSPEKFPSFFAFALNSSSRRPSNSMSASWLSCWVEPSMKLYFPASCFKSGRTLKGRPLWLTVLIPARAVVRHGPTSVKLASSSVIAALHSFADDANICMRELKKQQLA